MTIAAWIFCPLAIVGSVYTYLAAILLRRYRPTPAPMPVSSPDVVILKPLCGSQPSLPANLMSFLEQDYAGGVTMLCGVADPADPAVATVEALAAASKSKVTLVVNGARHGSNAKISNLINLAAQASAPVVVVSDSDIAVAPDYLRRLVTALSAEGVGAVTCLYRGRGDASGWSVLAAAGVSYQFLPSVVVGLASHRAHPCMGSTVALSARTLDHVGGFDQVADQLADDHALGAAVRQRGLMVVVPPMLVVHGCSETRFAELWKHEIRWNVTIRTLDPLGYAGSLITHPVPLALIAVALPGGAGWPILLFALLSRVTLKWSVDSLAGSSSAPLWMLVPRDILSLATFLAGLFTRSVEWRGAKFRMARNGQLSMDAKKAAA